MYKLAQVVLILSLLSTSVSMLAQRSAAPQDRKPLSEEERKELRKILETEFIDLKPLRLGCEKAGVELGAGIPCLDAGSRGWRYCIQLRHGQGKAVLEDLNQLNGWIKVADAQTALRVVRLRTAPSTRTLWPGWIRETEILPEGEENGLADYGVGQQYVQNDKTLQAFRKQGYSAPAVEKVPDGYRITRWLIIGQSELVERSFLYTYRIQKVQEWVGHEGGYKRKILSKDANWVMFASYLFPGHSGTSSLPRPRIEKD
jgi:hypothetical protein